MSAPNSHGACHDLALGPVPKQNARWEEREGVPPTPARARTIRSPAPTEPPSSRPSPTTINPPQARASRTLQVSQARRRPQVSRITLFVELPDRRSDRFGRPARRPRPRTLPSFRLVGFVHACGGWPNPRARSSRTPDRPQRASPALQSPPPFQTRASRTNPVSRRRRPRRLTRASPFSSPTTQRWIQREQQRVERRRRVRGAVHGARRAGGCRARR